MTAQSRFFAVKLTKQSQDIEHQVSQAWRTAFGKEITDEEKEEAISFVTEMQEVLTKEYESRQLNDDPIIDAVAVFCQALLSSNQFLYIE